MRNAIVKYARVGAGILVFGLAAAAPGRGDDQVQAGIAAYNQGKYPEAEAALAGQAAGEAQAYLAASRVRLGKHGEAEAPANEALRADPPHAVATAALGEALVAQKKYDAAIASMSGLIARRADLAYAFYWRGQAYYGKKQPDKMIGDLEAFLRLAPDAPEAAAVRQLLAGLR